MAGGRRLLGEHVDGRAGDALVREGPGQRGLVHGGAPPDVDEVGGGFHGAELGRPDHALGLRGEGSAHHHGVGAGEEVRELLGREPRVGQHALGIARAG